MPHRFCSRKKILVSALILLLMGPLLVTAAGFIQINFRPVLPKC
jgi:hypothetical protein